MTIIRNEMNRKYEEEEKNNNKSPIKYACGKIVSKVVN